MSPSPARILSVAFLLSTVFASLVTSAFAQGTGGSSGGNAATNNGPRSNVEIIKHWSMTAIGKQGAALLDTSMPGGKEQLKQGSIGQGGGEAQPEKIKCSDLGDGSCQWYDKNAGIPASAAEIPCSSKGCAGQTKSNSPHGLKGERASDTSTYTAMAAVAADEVANMLNPEAQAKIAQAEMQAQAQSAGNSCGEVEHNQSASAIDFCGKYLENFTVQGGNKWNQIRDHIFVPIGILLLLPGAVLTQVKAIVAAGTPVVQPMNPFEGILRSIVAVFLIPCTYLVINYGIDVANSITYTINSEYTRLFGSDMYRDAICAQLRAFPVRQPSENRNAYDLPTAVMGQALMGGTTPFAKLEATLYANKIDDPCAGLYILPQDRADEALPSSAIMAKLASNASNMALTTTWNILCAFQMAYLYYLWCVGPVVAGLWVWPMKQLRDALPSWVEGVITLCFWSLFWNTTVLLMACFRGVDETGTIIMSALNFLSTACVKFAFDFAGLVRAAGQEAAKMAEQAMEAAKSGGGGGGGGGASAGKGGGASAGSSGGASAGSSGGSAKSASNFAGTGVKPGVGTGHGITAGSSRSEGGPGSSLVSDTSSSTGVTSSSHALGMDSSTVAPPPTDSTSGPLIAGSSGSDTLTGSAGGDTYFGVGDSPINTPDSPSLLADMGLPPSLNGDSVSFSSSSSSLDFTDASTSNFNFMDGSVSFSGGAATGSSEAFLAGGAALSMSGFGSHADRSGDTHHNLFGTDNNWSSTAHNANHDWTTNNAWNQTTNVDASTMAANDPQTNGLTNFDNLLGTEFNQNMPLVQPDGSTLASSDITNASPTDISAPATQADSANNYYNSATYDANQQVTAYDQQQAAAAQASEQQQQIAQQQQQAAQELAQQHFQQQQIEQQQQQQQVFAQQNAQQNAEQYAAQGFDGQVIGSASGVSPDVSSFVNTDSGSVQMNSVPGAPGSEPAVSFSAPEITSNTGASAVSESYSYVSSDSTQQVIGGSDYLMSDATQASTSSTFADTATNSVVSYTDNSTQFSGTPDSPSYVNTGSTSALEYVQGGTQGGVQGGEQSVTNNVAYAGEAVISANTAGSFDTSTINNVGGDSSSATSYTNVDSSYVTSYTSGDGSISYSRDASSLGYTGDSASVSGYPTTSDYNTVSYTSQDTSGNVVSAGFVNAESGANVISTNTVNAEGFAAPGQENVASTNSYTGSYTGQDVYASASAAQDAIVSGAPDASVYSASSSTQEYISQSVNNQVGYAGESVISAGTAGTTEAQTNYTYDTSSTQTQYATYAQGSETGNSVNISFGEGTGGNVNQTGYIDAPVSGVYERPSNDSANVDYQSMPWNFGPGAAPGSGPGGETSYPTHEGSGYTAASLSEQGPSVFTQSNYGSINDATNDLYQASAGYATPIASGSSYTQAAYEGTSSSSNYQMNESAGATAGSSVGATAGSEFIQASYSGVTGASAAVNYSEPNVDAGNSYVPAIGAGFVQAAEPSVTYSNPVYERTSESGAPTNATGSVGAATSEQSGPLTPTPSYDSSPNYATTGSGEASVPAPAPTYAANSDATQAPSYAAPSAPTLDAGAAHADTRPASYSQGGAEATYQPGTTDTTPTFSSQPVSDTLASGQMPQQLPQQDPAPVLPIDSNQPGPGLVLAPITNESARPIPDGALHGGTTAGAHGATHPSGYDAPVQYYQHLADNSAGLAAELAAPHFTISAEAYERAANVEPIHDYGHAVHGTEPHITLTASDHQIQEQVAEACVSQKISVFTAAMGAAAVTRVATEQQHMKPSAPAPSEVTVSSAMPAQQTRGISLLARALGPAVSKKKLEPVAPPPMHDPSSST